MDHYNKKFLNKEDHVNLIQATLSMLHGYYKIVKVKVCVSLLT